MNMSDAVWSTRTFNGQSLGERVSKTPPTVRVVDDDNLKAFVATWNERLQDALSRADREMESKSRSLLEFVTGEKPSDIFLLLWGQFKLSAVYNKRIEEIFLIQ